ncbi:MAG: MoaD/ThiS family protein [Peptococcaceae bacterium]|nr:MoaD/ThiS family protein [Peptococcaceae bacterium]
MVSLPGGVRVKVLVLEVEKELMEGTDMEIPAGIYFDEFVDLACRKYPRFKSQLCPEGKLAPYARVFLNGKALTDTGVKIPPGSELVFFPAIHGG